MKNRLLQQKSTLMRLSQLITFALFPVLASERLFSSLDRLKTWRRVWCWVRARLEQTAERFFPKPTKSAIETRCFDIWLLYALWFRHSHCVNRIILYNNKFVAWLLLLLFTYRKPSPVYHRGLKKRENQTKEKLIWAINDSNDKRRLWPRSESGRDRNEGMYIEPYR